VIETPSGAPTPATPFPTAVAGEVAVVVPANGGQVPITLPSGQTGLVVLVVTAPPTIASGVVQMPGEAGPLPTSTPESVAGDAQAVVTYDPQPTPPNEAAAGLLGGGNVHPVAGPIGIDVQPQDPGHPLTGVSVDLHLPVIASCQPSGSFAWLVGVEEDGQFLGYTRWPASFDAATNTLLYSLPVDLVSPTLLLPACLQPAWVMNHDPQVHIWSGPTSDAVDFGVAAPQFTVMPVVGPQVDGRIYVYNPYRGDYGWIDAAGVGPVGPPP
jgi:hypothetical protein